MKFLVTKELGKLCKWLRILGYDTKYIEVENQSSIIINALREDRILLTRKSNIGKHFGIKILFIKFDNLENKLKQVINTFSLQLKDEKLFSRCIECNKRLELVPGKEKIRDKVPRYVYKKHQKFMECSQCGKVYWKGSHWESVKGIIEKL